ncbi:MAG: PP2C family protein-serine/threonine phosphatase [Candidatus Muiribacteriota bacterium]
MKTNFKILIVDDTDVNREFLKTLMESIESDFEYLVIESEDGKHALEVIDDSPNLDLIILDMMMPEYDGFYFLENFVKNENRNIPVIVMSALGDNKVIHKAYEYGIYDYFVKPLSSDQIMSFELKIKNALKMKQTLDELGHRKKIVENEILLASKMQRKFLPAPVENDFFSFDFFYQPYSGLSGDYVDYLAIDDENILIIMADVVGHGTSSAILGAMVKTHTRDYVKNTENFSLEEFTNSVNNELLNLGVEEVLVTAFFGLYNIKHQEIKYIVAGHPYPLIFNFDKKEAFFLSDESCLPLGLFPDINPVHGKYSLEKNDIMLVFTDGIMEAKTQNKEFFGIENIKDYIKELFEREKEFNPDIFTEHLMSKLVKVNDDISLIFFKVKK